MRTVVVKRRHQQWDVWPMTVKVFKYGRAMVRWIARGRPVRSDARVQEIFDTFCRPCRHFDAEKQTCQLCGCRVRRDGPAAANKLRMATERCPADPPRWMEETNSA